MNALKRFCCWIGWHSIFAGFDKSTPAHSDGFLDYARCKWCGYTGQIDSQGNLF
ncbi:hypothetical protein LCGC14_2842960 [marine sediment metagenome]|uniref:Uncharacterized protein n=1 Tax=marine sediment metagenome TaxID=412755 RepID=A0A0F8YAQ6_9ZZZZ